MNRKFWAEAVVMSLLAGEAIAGEAPLYQAAPAWVVEAPLAADKPAGADSSALLIFDDQQRIAGDQAWHYVDTALRIASPEMLAQMSSVALQWLPDKGDLVIHEVSILRGPEKIDLLAAGQKFEILRREQNLEQRQLTGILTASAAVEGLRVGDILRVRHSTTARDAALGGRVQSITPILPAPLRIGFGRMRALWPQDSAVKWQLLATGVSATPRRSGKDMELLLALPAPKQPDMPDDAPARFRRPPMLELASFADWSDVSRKMAPLYATDGLVAPDGPLAAEVAAISAAETTQLARAQRALELVQDKIRYFAVGMNGGNYVPQTPVDTWRLRYGDCKAKTLLLLALLHAMQIKAEPVLANIALGDLVAERIPSAAAFDHVLVRAEIDGRELWLDGTGSGSRLDDIHDTPGLRNVLPLRSEGAGLLKVDTRPNARPSVDVAIDADESSSIDLPSVYDATVVLRGPAATGFNLAAANLDQEKQKELIQFFLTRTLGEAQFSDVSVKTEPESATATLKAHGITTTSWKQKDKRRERPLGLAVTGFGFDPDRSKSEWRAIPVATPDPMGTRYRLRLRLPDGGKGYALEGDQAVKETLAGHVLERSIKLQDGILTLDERFDSTGVEIPLSQLAAERDRVAIAKARQPKLISPENATGRWNLADAAPGSTQLAGARDAYGRSIRDNPKQVEPYLSRANFSVGIGEFKAALTDLTKALGIAASKDVYLQRAAIHRSLGDLAAALADARSARDLDPSSIGVNVSVANILAEKGDLKSAIAALDERIALGGETSDEYREAKAALIGEFGEPAEALTIVDQLMEKKPGNPSLLNSRCWIKGTRAVQVDTALKDCTSAIELSSSTYAALDSRSVVWFRLGRYDDALRDLNAVLDQVPNLAPSRYMRGVVLAKLNRPEESAADLRIAKLIDPRVAASYERFGIRP